jgi:hypothetical protein
MSFLKIFALTLVISCSTQNKQEKSFASRLNGNNVDGGGLNMGQETGLIIPLRNKHANTSIRGFCEYEQRGQLLPLRGAQVILKKQEKTLIEGRTNLDGTFNLVGRVDDGDYVLSIISREGKVFNYSILVKGFVIELGQIVTKFE